MKNKQIIKLRYGENPNQTAFLMSSDKMSVFNYQASGKEISFNNIIDVDSGLKCLSEFKEPTAIIIKHTNPCGVASSKNINIAFKKAYESDSKSAFGGIVLLNKKVNYNLSKTISKFFFEVIIASDFEKRALDKLKKKKKLIIIKIPPYKKQIVETKSTIFGDIQQTLDTDLINKNFIKLASNKKGLQRDIDDLVFSIKVAKHLKSNAVVLSKNKQTLGLGHGQTNRVDALKFAIKNMRTNFKNKNFVCASDGFFPFTDSITLLRKNGCKTVAQPSGSINDRKIVNYANDKNISLYFIKNRLFKH